MGYWQTFASTKGAIPTAAGKHTWFVGRSHGNVYRRANWTAKSPGHGRGMGGPWAHVGRTDRRTPEGRQCVARTIDRRATDGRRDTERLTGLPKCRQACARVWRMGCQSRFSCLIGAIRQTGQGRAWSDGSCSSHGHGKLWAGKSRWTSRTGRPCAHGTCFACSSVSSDDCAHVRVRRLLHCVALRSSVSSAITDGTVTPALDDCASALCALDDCDARIGRLRVCALRIGRLRRPHWTTARLRFAH